MKLYTRTGDDGSTGLYGGERVPKDARRVRAYGTVDEANALVGVARAALANGSLALGDVDALLAALQSALFDLGADLATPEGRTRDKIVPMRQQDVEQLERHIDAFDSGLPPLQAFILPGGHPAAAALHHARTVVRRAEREVVTLAQQEPINPLVQIYLNRLSDLLFVLARRVNYASGLQDPEWRARAG